MASLLNYMSVIAYSTSVYAKRLQGSSESGNQWLRAMSKLTASATSTSQEITCILALISSSLCNEVPLPPYLRAPQSYHLNALLAELDPDILGVEHFLEPGYAAFAVTQITSKLISYDLEKILAIIKKLVGEVDFSFRIVPNAAEESPPSSSGKGKQE